MSIHILCTYGRHWRLLVGLGFEYGYETSGRIMGVHLNNLNRPIWVAICDSYFKSFETG